MISVGGAAEGPDIGGWQWAAALIVLGAAAPLLGAALADGLLAATGCPFGWHAAEPCRVAGLDLEPLIARLGGLAWMAFVTVPAGGAALLLLGIAYLAVRARRAHRARRSRP